jgi:hypothetical protein
MKSLIATALLLLHTDATLEETSLMQGLVARRGQLTPESTSRKDTTAKLMETATKMMKNGATPDVITFIETTITEVNRDILGVIVEEHNIDQQTIDDLLARFDAAVAAMEACAASVRQQHTDRETASTSHQVCRSNEALSCARSRKCEEELEELWQIVKHEESEMRIIHWAIHGEWCVGPDPPQPILDDPFRWQITDHMEGAETSESIHPYPLINNDHVIEFRRFSVEQFGLYIHQKPRVELAWENYNRKLLECAALEETWTLKVDECDELQGIMHDQACMHASTNRECASNFGHEYHLTMVTYNDAVTAIRQKEYDRKREWETLHIVTCLLETVYTHVIHSINSGDPCPTTESHPEQTVAEINTCHIIEESMTTNLTIDYGNPPPYPPLPPVVEPPCTQQYIWEESHFSAEIATSHAGTITAEGLGDFFTVLSAYGWAGCAAPKACIPCETEDLIVDPQYTGFTVCKAHQAHLHAGQMDWDTFKCLSGDQCVEADGRCNGVANCDDGSDEVGCDTNWGTPAVLGSQECQVPFVSDVQFQCGDGSCTSILGRCNGVDNCGDGSDEAGCPTTSTSLTLEAMTGFTATIVTPAVNTAVFTDRTYTFDSLGSFAGQSFIQMSNEDKHIRHSHVQMKLRLQAPTTVYVAKLDDTQLPWLEAEGWALTNLEGVSYHGTRETRHTDWSGEVNEDHYGPGEVWEKTFPAGAVELRGNNGGDGSYVMFMANPANPPTPPVTHHPVVTLHWNGGSLDLMDEVTCLAGPTQITNELGVPNDQLTGISNLQPGCEVKLFEHSRHCRASDDAEDNCNDQLCVSLHADTMSLGSMAGKASGVTVHCPSWHYGTPGGNTCPTSDVGEAECLAAVQHLLPQGQPQGRTHLVSGSWGWVPPGCSVQSHFTHGQNGDWAAHYNANSGGQNDGGYTPVCEASARVFTTALADTKCPRNHPHTHADRLFRIPNVGSLDITLAECYALCATTNGCTHFSHGNWQGGQVCMGCTSLEHAQPHEGFTAYHMANFA